MQSFLLFKGHSNFTLEDLIEIIVEKNGQLQSAFSGEQPMHIIIDDGTCYFIQSHNILTE